MRTTNFLTRLWMVAAIPIAVGVLNPTVSFGQEQGHAQSQQQAAPAASPNVPTTAAFDVADVHVSPSAKYPFMDGGDLVGDRYILHQATMTQIIAAAYHLDSDMVQGGPSWLDWDHFDIDAKAPPKTSKETSRLMLQSLLAQRFHLVVHNGTAPMPAYVLTAPGGKSKLKESEGTGDANCEPQPPPANLAPGAIPQIVVTCHNETMEKFAEDVHDWAGGYLDKPVVDSTGLKGAYDFDLKWTPRGLLGKAGADGISVFDAVDKQLGLKLTLETAPRLVLIVDSANETPTPNLPDIAKRIPPLPPPQIEVATIKPAKPDERSMLRPSGDQIQGQAISLKLLIQFAWDLDPNDNDAVVGAPKWLGEDKVDIVAKLASDDSTGVAPKAQQVLFQLIQQMLRGLIEDRFQMKAHMEDRPADAYDLVAVKPNLTKADPNSRTNCHQGPGADGKDPRLTNPIMNMLVTCQNMTMAQAAEEFPHFAAYYLYYPAVDKTGLTGGWDFTLSWSSGDHMPGFNNGGGSAQSQNGGEASDPNGALPFYDAVSKELGLKLVRVKRPEPVLVIDHIEEQPTAN